ncbi:MAG: hypothetical protein ABI759_28070 [Candidatus Solibacter sp.]
MQANRKLLATRMVAVTVILLAVGTMIDGVAREDVLMIALGLLLAATSMQLFRQ